MNRNNLPYSNSTVHETKKLLKTWQRIIPDPLSNLRHGGTVRRTIAYDYLRSTRDEKHLYTNKCEECKTDHDRCVLITESRLGYVVKKKFFCKSCFRDKISPALDIGIEIF